MVRMIIYGFLYGMMNLFRAVGWWRWRIEGLENLPPREAGGMILVNNHVHWIDIPVVPVLLPFAYRLTWLAKIEIFSGRLGRWFFTSMSVIPIRRGKRDLAALDTAEQAVRDGALLLIYPEGHRSRTGLLQQGRGGAVRLAMRSGQPIVPLAIIGSEVGLLGTLLRKPILVRIGKPYIVQPTPDGKIPPDMMERLTTDMMLRIAELLPPEQLGFYAGQLAAAAQETVQEA